MFNLVRRISHSFIPRPDRPWEDDPTSNAPAKRKKRRLSSTERHQADEDEQIRKKVRGESASTDAEEPVAAAAETQAVKEVTQGVKEVELEDKAEKKDGEEETAPESVPLPEEKSGELDELASSEVSAPPATVQGTAESSTSTEEESEPVEPKEKDLPEPAAESPLDDDNKLLVAEENGQKDNAEPESSTNDATEASQIPPTEVVEDKD